TPACLGAFQVAMALESAPSTPVALSRPIYNIAPEPVGSPTPCLGGGNRVFLDGNGDFLVGQLMITQATFLVDVDSPLPGAGLRVHVTLPNTSFWDFSFGSTSIGQPLHAQVYSYAEDNPPPNAARLFIYSSGHACTGLTGRFQIEE